jgi:hypothetical protein
VLLFFVIQKESMNPDLIPREGMTFRSDEEARDFYEQYAELAGFGVKLSNRKPYSRVMRCVGNSHKGPLNNQGKPA